MSAKALALAAALLATTAISTSANAGGVRLGFGFPLGNFTAHPNLSSGPAGTARGRNTAEHYEKPRVARGHHNDDDDAPVRKAKRAPKVEVADDEPAPKKVHRKPKVEVAEDEPAPKTVHRRPKVQVADEVPAPKKLKKQPKIEVAEEPPQVLKVKTAKLETTDAEPAPVSHAAPVIFIPETAVAVPALTGTQSTPAPIKVASLGPVEIKPPQVLAAAVPVAEPLKTAAKAEAKTEAKPEPKSEAKTAPKSETKATSVALEAKKLCRRFSAAIAGLIDVPCGD
jgi:hypothetical protein